MVAIKWSNCGGFDIFISKNRELNKFENFICVSVWSKISPIWGMKGGGGMHKFKEN